MKKPIDQQPLDEFFKRKLQDASITPGADGWARLQQKLTNENNDASQSKSIRRIGAAWYWSAGAAAACLALAFVWFGQDQPPKSIADNTRVTQVEKANNGQTLDRKDPVPAKTASEEIGKAEQKPTVQTAVPRENVVALDRTSPEQPANVPSNSVDEPTRSAAAPVIASQQDSPKQINLADRGNNEGTPVINNTPKVEQSALVNSERTLIVKVDEPAFDQALIKNNNGQIEEQSAQPNGKESRINRVFRQIKKLKEGEVLAKADESLNDTDDESGLFNRLVRTARSRNNQDKSHRQ